ncbi:hypothetical protein Acr_15g0007860 [Actinidia rufa]|uniref:Uncharacterized protein n=1 Tax=Actinidia rufa TaxID=165716 RepID=A0A7J0FUR0_9ERIC|nr:hypothetical protein Acr_15g0007860 [Actinidia rufa]
MMRSRLHSSGLKLSGQDSSSPLSYTHSVLWWVQRPLGSSNLQVWRHALSLCSWLAPHPLARPSAILSLTQQISNACSILHQRAPSCCHANLGWHASFIEISNLPSFTISEGWSILLGLLGTGSRILEGRPAQTNNNKQPGRGRSKPLRRGDQTKAMTASERAQRGVVEYVERTFERWGSGLFIDGVMGRVRGSRRYPRKDKYIKIRELLFPQTTPNYCGKKLGRATNSQYCSVSSALDLGYLKGDLHRRTKVNGRGEAARNPSGVEIRPRILVEMESLEMGILSTLPRPRARRRQYFNSDQLTSTLMVALASSVETAWRGSMDSFYLGQEGSEIGFGVLNAEMGLHRMDVWRCSVSLGARYLS